MDYTNFVKNYYRQALTQLKNFRSYNGSIVNVNRRLDIDSNFLHKEQNNSLFLPQFELNINAPTKCFIDFMNYYAEMFPYLGIVLANEERIKGLYKNLVDTQSLDDDEKSLEYINMVIGVGVTTLEQMGILER